MAFKIRGTELSTISTKKNFQLKNSIKDFSLWVLLIANILTIYIAIKEGWSFSTMMWLYWFQSIIIGFFSILKILSLENFTSDDFSINDKTFAPTIKTKFRAVLLFISFYGGFHLAYLIYLLKNTMGEDHEGEVINFHSKFFSISIGIFFLNHLFSYFYNLITDNKNKKLGEVTAAPFSRIIPMHFIIMIGSVIGTSPLLFLIIKTVADCKMHINEHYIKEEDVEEEDEEEETAVT